MGGGGGRKGGHTGQGERRGEETALISSNISHPTTGQTVIILQEINVYLSIKKIRINSRTGEEKEF